MASQPSKSLRNDLGRATLTVLPVGYSIPKKEIYVIITRKITRVSNFPRILGNYTHAQTVVTRRSFFPSHRTPGYEANSPLHTGDRGPLVATTYTSFACYSRCSNKRNGLPWCTNVGYSTVNTHTTHHTRLFRLPLPPTLLQALSTKANSLVGPPVLQQLAPMCKST